MNSYKINKGFIDETVGKNTVIFDPDESKVYTLNETAGFIFRSIKKGLDTDAISGLLLRTYDTTTETVKKDLHDTIKLLIDRKIITKQR